MTNRFKSLALATSLGVFTFFTNVSVNNTEASRVEEETEKVALVADSTTTTAKVEQKIKFSNLIQLPGVEFSFGGESASANPFAEAALNFVGDNINFVRRNTTGQIYDQSYVLTAKESAVKKVKDRYGGDWGNVMDYWCVQAVVRARLKNGHGFASYFTYNGVNSTWREENGGVNCYSRHSILAPPLTRF